MRFALWRAWRRWLGRRYVQALEHETNLAVMTMTIKEWDRYSEGMLVMAQGRVAAIEALRARDIRHMTDWQEGH